jgi:flavin-dependent dehydrogenase
VSPSDVLIIGAGPAGSIAGALLVARGYKVTVLERDVFPRFSIGESLLPQCMQFIEEAGMLDAIRSCAFQRKDGAVFVRGGRTSRFEFADQFTGNAWCDTFEVQRATFDNALAQAAIGQGVDIRFGEEIVRAEPRTDAGFVVARDRTGTERRFDARFILDASGFGRVLPRLLGLNAPSGFPVRRSLFTHVEDRIGVPGYDRNKILITVHPRVPDVWYWLIPFSNGRSSVGVVATEAYLESLCGDARSRLEAVISEDPGLAQLLADAVFDTPVNQITGYAANVTRLWGDGFALLGNAGEFLDPVFSSGVTIAMKSASLATAVLARQLRGESVDWEREYATALAKGVAVFRVFVESWYDGRLQDVIFSELKDARIKRMICSILAGYVWDEANPYVARARPRLDALAAFCAS